MTQRRPIRDRITAVMQRKKERARGDTPAGWCFEGLRVMRDDCQQSLGVPLPHLSMGMSNDFEVAIEEGATLVRVGRAIFGERM